MLWHKIACDYVYFVAMQVVEGLGGDTAVAVAVAKEQRKAAELQRELCAVRAEAAEALRAAHRKLGEADAEVKSLC